MAETYCGKTCENCSDKEALQCPGCKTGPGKRFQCECELAKCCQEKHHETCIGCSAMSRCGLYRSREHAPEYRLKRRALEAEQQQRAMAQAPFFGRWLWLLFWLIIPSIISSLGTQDVIAGWSPITYYIAGILGVLCEAVYGLILLRLSKEEPLYRKAGICCMVLVACSLLTSILTRNLHADVVALFSIPTLVLEICSAYYEIQGHASAVESSNRDMAERWRELWKWLLGSSLAMIGSVVLMLIIPLLGAIVLIAATIANIITGIAKLVMLYKTAQWFRGFATE